MSQVRVYINPFDDSGSYTSYQDVTKYVINKSAKIKQQIDNNEYDVGVYKYGNVTLSFNNNTGYFSDIDNIRSMFKYKRADSKVKITWQQYEYDTLCGVAVAGEAELSEEYIVYEGLLNDVGSKTDIREQNINFKILDFGSIFSSVETPYSLLSASDNISDILLDCLDQTEITSLLTVSAGNISLSIDPVVDDVSDFENTTVKEALDNLLEMSNSILYLKDNTIYITARTAAVGVSKTFYGQGSTDGIESITKLSNIRSGLNKTFNFWTWEETTLLSNDATSVLQYGVRKKEIEFSGITNNTTRANILADLKTEFSYPKQEMMLTVKLTYDTIDLDVLDRIAIDYPTVYFAAGELGLPIFGVAKFGEDRFPYGEWNLTIGTTTNFKILGKNIDLKKDTVDFTIKEI